VSFEHFCVVFFDLILHFGQQLESGANCVTFFKNGGSMQNGGSKSDFLALQLKFLIFFQSSFCIYLVLVHKFCGNKIFKKSKMAARIKKRF
jgi:hypothetical protein